MGERVIDGAVREALAQEGSAAFVTEGPGGPHLVATWQSYLRVLDDATLVFPAGGYRQTEENLRAGSAVQMIVGVKQPSATGFRLRGRAELQVDTPLHRELKQRFPWCRAAVVFHVERAEKVLG